jgi:hypothetical protein
MIQYETLIDRMKALKEETQNEIEQRRRRTLTLEGTPAKPTGTITEICNELACSGEDGERLACMFRSRANSSALVRELQKARKDGELFEEGEGAARRQR